MERLSLSLERRRQAFSDLVAHYQDGACGYAYGVLRDWATAEDAIGELQNLPSLSALGPDAVDWGGNAPVTLGCEPGLVSPASSRRSMER